MQTSLDIAGMTTPKAPGRSRGRPRDLDQFYTRPDVAASCMAAASRFVGEVGTWLEPSAGTGAFLDLLPRPRVGLDLERGSHPEIEGGVDFTTWTRWKELVGPIVTVGNPPFGRNASLALKFVNRAMIFSEHVCMILPRTFEKASMHAKVSRSHSLAFSETLASDSFVHDGRPYDVPCCFQVWSRLPVDAPRPVERTALSHPDFEFVDNQDMGAADAARLGIDFAFQRVGGGAGLCSVEGLSKSWKSHYWIRVDRERTTPGEVLAILRGTPWDDYRHSTAGNPSIGKGEVVLEYSKARPITPIEPVGTLL